jgi:hypothetical protein
MKEQNKLLEAALKLAESIRPYSLSEEERTLIDIIEQHHPKPKRVDWEPWTVEMVRNHKNFQETADFHNAEMERITK